jgi:propionate catabolism operon transcriptional regulator
VDVITPEVLRAIAPEVFAAAREASLLGDASRDIDNDTPPEPGDATPTLRERTLSAQADEIRAALDACGGDRERVCEQLGISKTTLWRRLRAAKR